MRRKQFFTWEEKIYLELWNLIHGTPVHLGRDRWKREFELWDIFIVKSFYLSLCVENFFPCVLNAAILGYLKIIWDSCSLWKIITFSLQILFHRLSTRRSLVRRKVLSEGANFRLCLVPRCLRGGGSPITQMQFRKISMLSYFQIDWKHW